MAGHGDSPLDHVVDHPTLELPSGGRRYAREIDLPKIAGHPDHAVHGDGADRGGPGACWSSSRWPGTSPRNHVSRGWFMNMFEAMVLFIRDQVARPAIGGHGADRFLPYLWTVFFFVLFNNLLGHDPRDGLGDGQHQRDGRAGVHDARRRC